MKYTPIAFLYFPEKAHRKAHGYVPVNFRGVILSGARGFLENFGNSGRGDQCTLLHILWLLQVHQIFSTIGMS